MITLETQEAGTGIWFPVIKYQPGNERQQAEAEVTASILQKLGLYACVRDSTTGEVTL